MTYFTQSVIADDQYMRLRVSSCAAQEGCADDRGIDPDQWTLEWRKVWSSSPGWDAAWESALASGIEYPGMDEAVITDGQILSQVQAMKPFTHVEDHSPKLNPAMQASREFVMQVLEPVNRTISELKTRVDLSQAALPPEDATEEELLVWLQQANFGISYTALASLGRDALVDIINKSAP